jgi:hypothetical protein
MRRLTEREQSRQYGKQVEKGCHSINRISSFALCWNECAKR